MGRALDVELRVIPSRIANPFVDRVHYSGKHVNNSQLHLGAFLDGRLHGVMSFGPPMDKSKVIGLVEGTPWNGMIELNRMAFDDTLPRNSESHCIGLAMRMLRKNAPHVKWVLSFADGCSCGDGTIYRASNFVLTGITKNSTILRLPNGEEISNITITAHPDTPRPELGGKTAREACGGGVGHSRCLLPRIRREDGGRLHAPIRLFHRQKVAQAPYRSRNSVFADSGSRRWHVQGREAVDD